MLIMCGLWTIDTCVVRVGSSLEAGVDGVWAILESRFDSVGAMLEAGVDGVGAILESRFDSVGAILEAGVDSVGASLEAVSTV